MRQIHFWEGVDIALKAIAALAVACLVILALTRCGASTESSYTPVVLAAHGCGGVTFEVGPGWVVGAATCERTVQTPDGLRPCTVVDAVEVNGVPIGRGAIEAVSDPACGATYGWFPAGLVVGAHAVGGDVVTGDGDDRETGADSAADPGVGSVTP